jgi:Zinc-binding
MCELCRQTFMVNARPPLLWQHIVAKHPPGTDPAVCFPVHMKDFDPNDPKGEKKASEAATAAAAAAVKPKKPVVKKDDALDSLLDAGLKKGKK